MVGDVKEPTDCSKKIWDVVDRAQLKPALAEWTTLSLEINKVVQLFLGSREGNAVMGAQ